MNAGARCGCRCHNDATGDVREATQLGRFFDELLAKNREENLAARHPDGPLFTDEIAAFFACSLCQPKHSVALSSGREIAVRERAEWNPGWGARPLDHGSTPQADGESGG